MLSKLNEKRAGGLERLDYRYRLKIRERMELPLGPGQLELDEADKMTAVNQLCWKLKMYKFATLQRIL